MTSRQVIFSADDFGLSPGVNAGILKAHREGLLTNASLMVNGAAFEEAVELARATPTLSVGLHLVLVQGRSTSSPDQIPGLVDAAGMFSTNPVASGFRYFVSSRLRPQLEREVCAQLERFLNTGLELSHVDGHLNIHMQPTVLAILLRNAKRFAIRAVRLPREPLKPSLRLDARDRLRKTAESIAFRSLCKWAEPRLHDAGIHHADQMFGLHTSGHMTEALLLGLLDRLPAGVTEIYSHASIVDEEARRWRPADYECEGELQALLSERVRTTLAQGNIELTSYRQLSHSER
ncbi:MAG TPA: hopanoid biosynthesis-associated protein HpnK [Candidatus Acidoferrales bacterium]|nr:hopanoid biosynthesis-associated protein HpnK [Candidatus Acidoferrales bacterium]